MRPQRQSRYAHALLFAIPLGACLFPSVDGLVTGASDASTDRSDAPVTYRDVVMSDQPIAYWRFGDKGSDPTALDERGKFDGLIVGAHVTKGVAGAIKTDTDTAFHFGTETDTYVDVAAPGLDFVGNVPCAFEMWIQPIATPKGFNALLGKDDQGDGGGGGAFGYNLYISDDGQTPPRAVYARLMQPTYSSTSGRFAYGQWHHVVATFDGTTQSLYIDNTLVEAKAGLATSAVSRHFVIGGDIGGTGVRYEGDIDEVAVYDHVLDTQRISAHYAAAGY